MDKQQATDFIVSQLAKNRSRHDIITTVCERTGASWELAEQFVRLVEAENRSQIVAGQSPLVIGMGVFFILAGLMLVIYMAVEALNGVWYALPIPTPAGLINLPYLGTLSAVVTGLGMLAGGIVGVLRASRTVLKIA